MSERIEYDGTTMGDNEEKIDRVFSELVTQLSDDEWWVWVRTWLDVGTISDTYNNWDTGTKKEAIKELEELMNERLDKKGDVNRNKLTSILEKAKAYPLSISELCRLTGINRLSAANHLMRMEHEGKVTPIPRPPSRCFMLSKYVDLLPEFLHELSGDD